MAESDDFADLIFATGEKDLRPPAFITDYELRKAGFNEVSDSESAMCELLNELIENDVLPSIR